jgi:hypothetical protein
MSDDGSTQDDAANGPVAWAALHDDGYIAWIGYTPEGAADGAGDRRIVPLYRSPTLTDVEREAIEWAAYAAAQWYEHFAADTLRGLLERTAVTKPLPEEKRA